MTKRALPVLGLIAASLVFVSPAFAGENISNSPAWPSWAPRATADAAGNFYVVWTELYPSGGGDLFFTKYTKSAKTWSTPQNLSGSGRVTSEGNDNAGIACDGSGNVHVVWTERTIVRLRTLSGGGNWSTAGTIGEGALLEGAKIAASGAGNLYIVWWGDDGIVRSRSRVNGNWEAARRISSSRRSKFADIAVGSGSVMAVFSQTGSYYYNAAYVLRGTSFGAGWSAPAVVSGENRDQIYPDCEFLNGTAPQVIFLYENIAGEPSTVIHCAWTGNGFGPRQVISYPGALHCPSLIEKSGVLVATWQIGGWNRGLAIYYNYFYNGQWKGPTAIPDSRMSTYSDAALDPAGAALAVWDGNGDIMALIMTSGESPTPNNPPVADFSFQPATGSAPLTVNFDAGASTDPDGTIAAYDWIFGDGQTASGRTVVHTFQTPGTFTNSLTVTDNLGATNTKVKNLEVINKAPVPAFTMSSPSLIVTVKIDFDAGSSYDPDGTIAHYDWIFGDGWSAQGQRFSRVFTRPGTYVLKLTVTDNFGKKASLTKTFTLLALQPPLNVRWESFVDESLFQTRVVTDVQWQANPANEAIAPIVKYRVFRKKPEADAAAYQLAAETDGTTFFWRDTGVTEAGRYVYLVKSVDAAGHESLMPDEAASNALGKTPSRRSQGVFVPTIRR